MSSSSSSSSYQSYQKSIDENNREKSVVSSSYFLGNDEEEEIVCCFQQRQQQEQQEQQEHDDDNKKTLVGEQTVLVGFQPQPSIVSLRKKIALVTFGIIQNVLAGGLLFGWASIAGTVLVSSEESGGANLSSDECTKIFAIASSVSQVSPFVLGCLLDSCGPRCCSVASNAIVCVGIFVFALAGDDGDRNNNFFWKAVSTTMFAFGGPGVGNSLVHLGNLFPSEKFFVISLVSGAVTVSMAIFLCIGTVWDRLNGGSDGDDEDTNDNGYYDNAEEQRYRNNSHSVVVGYQVLFALYGFVLLLSTVLSYLVWPDVPFQEEDKIIDDYDDDTNQQQENEVHIPVKLSAYPPITEISLFPMENNENNSNLYDDHEQNPLLPSNGSSNSGEKYKNFIRITQEEQQSSSSSTTLIPLKDRPFRDQVCSGPFFRTTGFFAVCCFWANFYVATLTTELADEPRRFASLEEQHEMAEYFTLVTSLGIVPSFVVGALLDRIGFFVTSILAIVCGIAYNVLAKQQQLSSSSTTTRKDDVYDYDGNDNFQKMIASFVMYCLFRSFLFPVLFASLSAKMGFRYFGMLSGMSFAVSGILQTLVAPLAMWSEGDCHNVYDYNHNNHNNNTCNYGRWDRVHDVQIVSIFLLSLIPLYERCVLGGERGRRANDARKKSNGGGGRSTTTKTKAEAITRQQQQPPKCLSKTFAIGTPSTAATSTTYGAMDYDDEEEDQLGISLSAASFS